MEEFEQINKLSEEEKNIPKNILQEIIMYLYTNGLIIKYKDGGVNHIPIMLTPSPIPKNIYEKIVFYQIAFNKIINKLSNDQKFLEETLTPISENDNFVKRNLEISKKLVNYEHKQKIKLGIFRNDYLFDKNQNFLFFTEYNTIASSMGTFSDKIKKFYSYFSQKYPEIFKKYSEKEIPVEGFDNIEKFADSMHEAIKLAFPQQYKESIIVFVIQKNETNIFDQYSLSDELYNKYKIPSIRMTLEEIKAKCVQDENGNLTLNGQFISLFYFRASYTENDFPNEESWQGRELIELSTKIKAEPEKYILKPMKEGGGNNITGEKLKNIIPEEGNEISDLIKNSVIVEKIDSYEHEGLVIRNEKIEVQNSISEYSIYGIILANENNIIINKNVSFLVRTKHKKSIEGGIIEGAGAVDIPCLLNIKLETKLSKKVEISAEEIQKYLDDLKAEEEARKKEEEARKKEEEEKKKEEEKKTEEEKKKEEEKKNDEEKKEENAQNEQPKTEK